MHFHVSVCLHCALSTFTMLYCHLHFLYAFLCDSTCCHVEDWYILLYQGDDPLCHFPNEVIRNTALSTLIADPSAITKPPLRQSRQPGGPPAALSVDDDLLYHEHSGSEGEGEGEGEGTSKNINHFKQRVQRRDSGRDADGEGGGEEDDDGESGSMAEEGRSESDEEIEIEHVRYCFTLTTILLLTACTCIISSVAVWLEHLAVPLQ